MTHVTVTMLCAHARRSRSAVVRALRAAQVPVEKLPGCKGGRIALKDANRFLMRHWPDVGPIIPARWQVAEASH